MTVAVLLTLFLSQTEPSLGQGRAYVRAFRQGDLTSTWSKSAHAPGQRFRSLAALQNFAADLRKYGEESKVVSEGLSTQDGLTTYRRVMAVSKWARGIEVELTMDTKGRLLFASMRFAKSAAPTTYGAYRSLVALRLPLEDSWNVLWGGRTWDDNRHASVSDMRFALDLLQRRNGSTFQGKGTKNEDYFAWNQPVVAPADGVVVAIENEVGDNVPNHPVGGILYGNLVVIDHGTDEFTLMGHLKKDSVIVRVGERVSKGQSLARVGNSGMSTEPHLHFQLMDTADWRTAHGLPLKLKDFVRNGKHVESAEPRRGDIVAPSSLWGSR